jgi:hypothetical protein
MENPTFMQSDMLLEFMGSLVKDSVNDPRPLDDIDQLTSAQESQALDEDAAFTAPVMPTEVEEPENGALLDIDIDRFSAMSLASSTMSGFASFQSLSRRIKERPTAEKFSNKNSTDDLPSTVMQWEKSSNCSLRLFGQISGTLSVASSTRTDCSHMSWKPKILDTLPEGFQANVPETNTEKPIDLSGFDDNYVVGTRRIGKNPWRVGYDLKLLDLQDGMPWMCDKR